MQTQGRSLAYSVIWAPTQSEHYSQQLLSTSKYICENIHFHILQCMPFQCKTRHPAVKRALCERAVRANDSIGAHSNGSFIAAG